MKSINIVALLASIPNLLLSATVTNSNEEAKLAMQLSNPVAALISVPLQSNWDFGIGVNNAYRYTLNVQPVIPITLNSEWNLISRTILPIIDAESPAPGIDNVSGIGDITQSLFFSPQKPTEGGLIWGVGPVVLIPSASNDLLGSDKWGAGPTIVLLKQQDGWTYGMLANQIWSFGDNVEAVNSTYVQPFISYTTKTHTTFGLNAESTYNWEQSQLTLPFNLTLAQLIKIGELPVQLQVGGRYYADKPEGGPDWGLRFTVTFLFPK
ncbi:MAG: transporter [Gloeobacteraceae cyanobacterium ES-bin-144]|nr:transporter [Verrucomicrobiales bacterium]